jgi:hypothetical protein
MSRAILAALLAGSLALSGCGSEDKSGPDMRPGENCLACHGFSAAGTVYDATGAGAAGVTVRFLTAGTTTAQASAVTSGSGNFHTSAPLVTPFDIELSRAGLTRTMSSASGACNTCHAAGGSKGHIIGP